MKEVTELTEVGPNTLLVGTKNVEHLSPPMANLSLILASFTTAHARIRLC